MQRLTAHRSLAAYGILILPINLVLLQKLHQDEYPSRPHFSQTTTSVPSEDNINLSNNRAEAPYPIKQSRSISPNRNPPSLDRPSVGCLVRTARGPLYKVKVLLHD